MSRTLRSGVRPGVGAQVWAPVMGLVCAAVLVACESGPSASDGEAGSAVEAAADAPQVCQDLAAQDRLTGLRETVRQAAAGEPLQVQAAVETLQAAASQLRTAQDAADALMHWSAAPSEADRLDMLATSFNALEEEVQAQCDFPLS